MANKKEIISGHQSLLFRLGYPQNETSFLEAKNEMSELCKSIKALPRHKKDTLIGSGISFTETQGSYSFFLIKWLLARFPDQVSLHSLDESGVHPREVFKLILPEMEFELTADERSKPLKWLEKASGSKNKATILKWIIRHIEKIPATELIRDQLFESLQLYTTIRPKEIDFSKSFGNTGLHKTFYHTDGILKKFDEHALINRKLPAPRNLSLKERSKIIETSRIALCLLNRETDPITYCNEEGILYYELEHGLSIALFSMLPAYRLPLESYIGFMMFKNGYPMAYGGGWLFGKRSLLGINIFESFRGGESAFVFAQLLRTYKNAFGANYFEVEPYQFGKDNPEGLHSGAFWFYYRFGFRPVDASLNDLATREFKKIQATKGYRTPIETLKLFTKSNVALNFSPGLKVQNPSEISKFITQQIIEKFNSDRIAAEKWCNAKLKKELGLSSPSKKLKFFVAFCIRIEKLNKEGRNILKNFIQEKERSEFKYIDLCRELLSVQQPNS